MFRFVVSYVLFSVLFCVSFNTKGQTYRWREYQKLVASDRASNDHFGNNTFIDSQSRRIIVGARNKNSGRGAAYIFERNTSTGKWFEAAKLLPSDPGTNNLFGVSVGIWGDYAAVGAFYDTKDQNGNASSLTQPGSAYIYERNSSGQWLQKIKIISPNRSSGDNFGNQVRVQGNEVFIASYKEELDTNNANSRAGAGAIYIYQRNSSGNWIYKQKIVASDRGTGDQFGINMEARENKLIVGAYLKGTDDRGGAYIFEKNSNGYWVETYKLISNDIAAGDNFGRHADIKNNYAIVGATEEDEDQNGANYVNNAGSAYIFEFNNSTGQWVQKAKVVAPVRGANEEYGLNTFINGNHALVVDYLAGSSDTGACYYYLRDPSGNWGHKQTFAPKDVATNDLFGSWLNMAGDYSVIGAIYQDRDTAGNNFVSDAGAAYIFELVMDGECYYTASRSMTMCGNDSVFLEGKYRKISGIYTDTVQKYLACDSIIHTTLTVQQPYSGTVSVSICNGDSVFLQKMYRKTSGVYYDTLISSGGCDSIITVQLSVASSITGYQKITICPFDSVLISNKYIKQAGTYYDTFSAQAGCDSIVTIELEINQPINHYRTANLCTGDSLFFINKYLKNQGTYTDTVYTIGGCADSIITLNLTVLPIATANVSLSICIGQFITVNGKNVGSPGIYYDSTKTVVTGCDSITTINLSVLNQISTTFNFNFCVGDSVAVKGTFYSNDTLLIDTFTSASGCDSLVLYTLKTSRPDINLPDSAFFCEEVTNIDPGIYTSYLWSNGYSGRILQTLTEGIYTITVTDSLNCKANDSIIVMERCEPVIFVPTAFSPNGDGKNDLFIVHGYNILNINFMIFDRWGEKIFEQNGGQIIWDGTYKKVPLPDGEYIWICSYNGLSASERLLKKNATGIIFILR